MNDINIPWPEWKAVGRIGNGSFGSVYEIKREDEFGYTEKAALKVISLPKEEGEIDYLVANGYDNDSITEYYRIGLKSILDEYAMMARLKSHPNIVGCEDRKAVRQENGVGWDVFIRMELLKPFLKDLKDNDKTEEDVIKLGKDLLNALTACHKLDIIHRDIKPENIFITEYGDYKLGDFGVARIMSHTTNATRTGTLYYMAPEVYNNERYGKEADIYSLGLVLYWLLNNKRLPFEPTDHLARPDEKEEAKQRRLAGETVPDPVNGNERLKAIIKKALAYDPKDRYRSAEEMQEELLNVNEKEKVDIHPDSQQEATESDSPEADQNDETDREDSWIENNETIGKASSSTQIAGSDIEQAFRHADEDIESKTMSSATTGKNDDGQSKESPKAAEIKTQIGAGEEIVLNDIRFIDTGTPMPTAKTLVKAMFSKTPVKEEKLGLPSDVVAVSRNNTHCVYLRSNGTVVARGWKTDGQCNVSHWRDIVAIATGYNHTVGLRSNGTVIATGADKCSLVSGWSEICAIAANDDHTVGLRKDGRVVAAGIGFYGETKVSEWSDIVAISAGRDYTVGLKSDGTVVATGKNDNGQCNVSEWKDIIAISATYRHTVGLKADGTVVATGDNRFGQCNVSEWNDIIAVSADDYYTLAWNRSGSLFIAGKSIAGEVKLPVIDWGTIAAISTARCHKVCLNPNETVTIKGVAR